MKTTEAERGKKVAKFYTGIGIVLHNLGMDSIFSLFHRRVRGER
jgi:hypothetical protein